MQDQNATLGETLKATINSLVTTFSKILIFSHEFYHKTDVSARRELIFYGSNREKYFPGRNSHPWAQS